MPPVVNQATLFRAAEEGGFVIGARDPERQDGLTGIGFLLRLGRWGISKGGRPGPLDHAQHHGEREDQRDETGDRLAVVDQERAGPQSAESQHGRSDGTEDALERLRQRPPVFDLLPVSRLPLPHAQQALRTVLDEGILLEDPGWGQGIAPLQRVFPALIPGRG